MANSADPDQLASSRSQLIWIYTVCKDRVYPGSEGQGLRSTLYALHSLKFIIHLACSICLTNQIVTIFSKPCTKYLIKFVLKKLVLLELPWLIFKIFQDTVARTSVTRNV